MVVLITGKRGSGKTIYALKYKKELENLHYLVKHIDGDEFRKENNNDDYSDEEKIKNLITASELASLYESKGYVVLMSFIMPKKKWRNMMRKKVEVSRIVYIPGGTLWKGTSYEMPTLNEFEVKYNYK